MLRSERQTRASEALRLVGLEAFADAFPYQLSGGMRSRVALARSLVLEPCILLMDEPFSRLDALTRAQMHDELLRIQQLKQMTIVFVTHDVDEAVYLGDRVYIFSPAPGSILHQLDVPPPDRPARVMQREPEFMAISRDISNIIEKLETKVSDS